MVAHAREVYRFGFGTAGQGVLEVEVEVEAGSRLASAESSAAARPGPRLARATFYPGSSATVTIINRQYTNSSLPDYPHYQNRSTMQSIALDSRLQPARLQDDILCEVFYVLAEIDPPGTPMAANETYYKPGSLGWISITHVCRRWRKIGLDLSKLWADIICVFPRGVDTIAQRTKNQLLNLDLDLSRDPEDVWDAIQNRNLLARAHTLRHEPFFCGETRLRYAWSTMLMDLTLPQLRELSLVLFDFPYSPRHPQRSLNAPNLRTLALNLPLAITANSLTHFHAIGAIWHYKVLLKILASYPFLISFEISAVYGDNGGMEDDISSESLKSLWLMIAELDEPSIVQLQHLRSLKFNSVFGSEAMKVLHYLDLPANTLFIADRIWDKDCVLELIPYREVCCTEHKTLTITDTAFAGVENLEISFTEDQPYLGLDFEHDEFERGLLLATALDAEDIPDMFDAVSDAQTIQTIAFNHDCSHCTDSDCGGTLRKLDIHRLALSLRRFSNVTTLHLECQESNEDIFLLLAKQPAAGGWILHALRELIIAVEDICSQSWWSHLRVALAFRVKVGHQVQRLTVRGGGACHAYYKGYVRDEAYLRATEGLEDDQEGASAAWLKYCAVTLRPEQYLVTKVVDERELDECDCAAMLSEGEFPWDT
ncbi:hypothetical protein PENSPDRAFT_692394 [Peniophora sp. CONT]|nr:hypothetical protein PENSPDRAFT_692394 [Peniophora sp. CONT]